MWNTNTRLMKFLFLFTVTLFITGNWKFAQCEETDEMLDQLAMPSEVEESIVDHFHSPVEGMRMILDDDELESVESNPIEVVDSVMPGKESLSEQPLLHESQTTSALAEPEVDQSAQLLNNEDTPMKAEGRMVNELHQQLVTKVIADQQQAILNEQSTNTESSKMALSSSSNLNPNQGQIFAQNPDDGQLYSLTPLRSKETSEFQEAYRRHQLQRQATLTQAQQLLKAQIELQNLRAQVAATTLKSSNQDQQLFSLGPIHQEYLNQPFILQSQPIREQNQPQTILQLIPNTNPFLQKEFVSIEPQRQVRVEQAVLRPQFFRKAMKNQEPILKPVEKDLDMSKLVTEVGLRYTPLEDTAQYTIYKVKEAESRFQAPQSRPITPTPQLSQPNFRSFQSRPIKIRPAPQSGYNYNPKPVILKSTSKPQQVVYKSSLDPDYYNAVKSKLLASFLRNRIPTKENGGYARPLRPFQPLAAQASVRPTYELSGPFPSARPTYEPLGPFHSVRPTYEPLGPFHSVRPTFEPHKSLTHFEPLGFSRQPSTRSPFERKPFRPSPVDLGPFYTEPLFEPIGHNSPIPQPTTTYEQIVHPSHFTSKFLDIDYSPGISLPPNEAAFAAIQARLLGGPHFVDPGYFSSSLGEKLKGKALQPISLNKHENDVSGYGDSIRHAEEAEASTNNERQPSEEHLKTALFSQENNFEEPVSEIHPSRFSPPASPQGLRTGIANAELKEIDANNQHMMPPQLLAQILKATTGDDLELENYY